MHVVIAKTTPSGRVEPHLLNLQQLNHTLLLNGSCRLIVSLVTSISKFLKNASEDHKSAATRGSALCAFHCFKFFSSLSLSLLFLFSSSESDYNTEFDCFLYSLRTDSTTHEMKGLTRDRVLSMHHLLNQFRTFENLPYHVSGNDVSEIILLIVSNEKFT